MIDDLEYTTTGTPMHLTVDPLWGLVEVLAYGTTCDLLDRERYHVVDEQVAFVLDAALSEIVGFVVRDYAEFDAQAADVPELLDGPRFRVPVLGLSAATAGEVLLAIGGRFAPGEPTADALHLHAAIAHRTPPRRCSWLGKACAGSDSISEARAAFERAIELADDETDAPELLAELCAW